MPDMSPSTHQVRRARRIPDGLPFALRARRRPAVGLAVALVVAVVVTFLGRIPLRRWRPGTGGWHGLDFESDPVESVLTVAIMVLLLAVAVILLLTAAFGGPLLACDGDGLWVRSQRFPGRAVFLRWEELRSIHPLPHWKMVGVIPVDPRVGDDPGVAAAAERFGRSLLGLPRFGASTILTPSDEKEVLAELARYARGRCEIRPA